MSSRVLLIQSPLSPQARTVPECHPPLGLMSLASYLREKGGHDVQILDMLVNELSDNDMVTTLDEFKPHVVGFTAMSLHASEMHRLAGIVKDWNPHVHVTAGGPHASSDPARVVVDTNIDTTVLGEGEATALEVVNAVEDGETTFHTIPGLALKGNGVPHYTDTRDPIDNLDTLPFPAWDLIETKPYFHPRVPTQNGLRYHRAFMPVFSSRACPYGCIFCHNIFGKSFRKRSPERIVQELVTLHTEHGIKEFHFIDDVFNLHMDWAKSVLRGLIQTGIDVKIAFPNGIRGDHIDSEMLDLFLEAGVYKTNFGIESGVLRIQKMIEKSMDLTHIRESIRRVSRAGIITHGFFMLGFPSETLDEMEQTIEFAENSSLEMAGFNLVTPFPGTPLYDKARDMGYELDFDTESGGYSSFSANLSAASSDDLQGLRAHAYRKFYFKPGRMARLISRMPNKMDLLRAVRHYAGIKFFS